MLIWIDKENAFCKIYCTYLMRNFRKLEIEGYFALIKDICEKPVDNIILNGEDWIFPYDQEQGKNHPSHHFYLILYGGAHSNSFLKFKLNENNINLYSNRLYLYSFSVSSTLSMSMWLIYFWISVTALSSLVNEIKA